MKTTDLDGIPIPATVLQTIPSHNGFHTTKEKPGESGLALRDPESISKYKISTTEASAPKIAMHRDSSGSLCIYTLVCLSWLAYFGSQLRVCLQVSETTFAFHRHISWLFFVCEIVLAGPEFFQILELTLSVVPGSRQAPRACYRLEGQDAPLVHVFVTTCGEDPVVVMRTLASAVAQNYPQRSYRVFVLDDAGSSRLKLEVHKFNSTTCIRLGAQPVIYLARSKRQEVRHYYKAGNLSFGIHTSKTDYGGSEFIAGLDVDMIVEPDWLQRVVPHLVLSPELAVVSPPQSFYNVPDHDVLAQDASVLQQVLEPARDRIGCSMCHGSGYVMRRAALETIGGWPLVNIGEDILCSYLLNQKGWQTAFIQDELQFGVTCESFHAYVSQRMRWTAGNLLSAHRFHLFLPHLERSEISVVQRLHGFMQSVKTYAWIALILPLVVLPVGLPLSTSWYIPHTVQSSSNYSTPKWSFIVMWLSTKLWKRLNFGHVGLGNLFNLSNNRLWITPYIVCAWWQSLWCDLAQTDFEISGTFESPLNERSTQLRPSLVQRMLNPLILMHTLYWLVASTTLMVHFLRSVDALRRGQKVQGYLFIGLTMRLLEIAVAALVPVRYITSPPSAIAAEGRTAKDGQGVERAIGKTWTKRTSSGPFWKDLAELLIVTMCYYVQ